MNIPIIIIKCENLLKEYKTSNNKKDIIKIFKSLFLEEDCSDWIILNFIEIFSIDKKNQNELISPKVKETLSEKDLRSIKHIIDLYIIHHSDELYNKIQSIKQNFSNELVEKMISHTTHCSDKIFSEIKSQNNLTTHDLSIFLRDKRMSENDLLAMIDLTIHKYHVFKPVEIDYFYISNLVHNPNLSINTLKLIIKKYRHEIRMGVLDFILNHPYCSFEWVCEELDTVSYKDLSNVAPSTVQKIKEYTLKITEYQKLILGRKIPMLYKMGLKINALDVSIDILEDNHKK